MLEHLLLRLGLDAGEIKTYLALLEFDPITAGALSKKAGVVRVTQYVVLKRLIAKGFATQSYKNGVQLFSAESPEKITLHYDEHIKMLERDRAQYQKLLPALRANQRQELLTPKFQIFEGADGLKNVLKDMLLYKNMETQAYWPIKKMVEILSPDFFRYHNRERIKNNLYTRAIWPKNEVVPIKTHPYLGSGEKFKREIRVAPAKINFSMGYWIYGTKAAFLSSRKESVGFIIESSELVEMLRSQFEIVWNLSKPLGVNPRDTEEFARELPTP